MSIKKPTRETLRAQNKSYTTLINSSAELIKTTDAYAVWAYLQGKPADWTVYRCELQSRFANLGRDKLSKALNHLKEVGLMVTQYRRGSDGKLAGKEIIILDEPNCRTTEIQSFDRTTENPTIGKTAPTNNINKYNINNITKERSEVDAKSRQSLLSLFKYWQDVMKHPRAILDDKRKRKLNWALKSYGLEQAKKAIDGCANSPFHMGHNDSKTKYDGIHVIFKNSDVTEGFIDRATAPKVLPKQNIDKLMACLPNISTAIQLCIRNSSNLHPVVQIAFQRSCKEVRGKSEFGRLNEFESHKLFKKHLHECAQEFLQGELPCLSVNQK